MHAPTTSRKHRVPQTTVRFFPPPSVAWGTKPCHIGVASYPRPREEGENKAYDHLWDPRFSWSTVGTYACNRYQALSPPPQRAWGRGYLIPSHYSSVLYITAWEQGYVLAINGRICAHKNILTSNQCPPSMVSHAGRTCLGWSTSINLKFTDTLHMHIKGNHLILA